MDVSPKLDGAFRAAVRNSVARTRTDLLDFVDLQKDAFEKTGQVTLAFFEIVRRRILSSTPNIEHQVLAAWEIAKNGGEIPPFGRTPEQLAQGRPRPSF